MESAIAFAPADLDLLNMLASALAGDVPPPPPPLRDDPLLADVVALALMYLPEAPEDAEEEEEDEIASWASTSPGGTVALTESELAGDDCAGCAAPAALVPSAQEVLSLAEGSRRACKRKPGKRRPRIFSCSQCSYTCNDASNYNRCVLFFFF